MNEVGASTVAATDDVTALKWAQNIKDNIQIKADEITVGAVDTLGCVRQRSN